MWYDEFGIMTQEQVSMTRNAYQILLEGASAEIVEKKSRFIATIRPVKTEEEASAFIEKMKKQYWDARHNCSAFVVGENNCITRCSDDGEPSGTAGRPMLEVLLGSGITNIAVVVTRYFGGVLLGTGGLVRAYQGAVQEALPLCKTGIMLTGTYYQITASYADAGKIQNVAAEENIDVLDTEYGENVRFRMFLTTEEESRILAQITDRTAGRATMREESKGTFLKQKPGDIH